MLEPTTRHLFTDGLRPPPGFAVDLAVGTTYTVGLSTLLLPPLAMAAHDRETAEDESSGDGIALLEAVRRFAERMTVFCHAGGIHVPGRYRRILTFAEDSLVEALPEQEGHIFHPKVWVLRFTDGERYRHRLLCLSRNLTADTSWDTIVQLEETDRDRGIDAAPAAAFIQSLSGLAVHPLPEVRLRQLTDLGDTVQRVRFAVPEPFASGELWPLGVGSEHGWPVHTAASNAVVVSPFLDRPTVQRVRPRGRRVFVSRPETYTSIGGAAFTDCDVRVLDPLAETALEGDEHPHGLPWEVRTGLHAKTFVWDYDGSGWCLTGSANATSAAFNGNVEFSVLLRGAVRKCGVGAFLPDEPPKGELSLARVLVPHTIENVDPELDPTRAAELAAGAYYASLVRAGPVLTATRSHGREDRYDVQLTFVGDLPPSPGDTTVRILSRTSAQHARAIDAGPCWTDVGVLDLTPFLAVRTSVAVEGLVEPLHFDCVVKAELLGAPEDRSAQLLRSLLDSEESVLRYLSFLLDESGADAWGLLQGGDVERNGNTSPSRPTFDDIALLETLVRAAARGDESLQHVHALLRDLREDDGQTTVVSEEFLNVWEAVWAAASNEGGRS